MPGAVLTALREQLERARSSYKHANEVFWRVSTLSPQPGPKQIEEAAREQTWAMIAYAEAMKRLNEFLLEGKVPDDLRESESRKGSAASA